MSNQGEKSGGSIKGSRIDSSETLQIDEVTDYPEGGKRAWICALGATGIVFSTFGFANSFGIFEEYYITHQLSNSTASAISWIGSIQNALLFAGTAFGGPLFDRYGSKVLWPAVTVYVFAIMMTSICKELYQFILCQGILAGACMGMCMAPSMAAVGQYFQVKRAAAFGMVVAGSSLGGVVFPVAINKMLDHPKLGFGWTVRICGFMIIALIFPSAAGIRARLPPRKSQFWLFSAFKELQYVTLIGAIFLMILGCLAPLFYLPTFAVQNGMSTELAFYLTAILNAASFFGRISAGVVAIKAGRLNMLCLAAISTGILCFCWQKAASNTATLVFAAIFGFFSGTIVSLMSVALTTVSKDPRNLGTYLGQGMFCVSIAALTGPPINGALVSHYGNFNQTSIFSGVVLLAGGFMVILVKYTTGKGVFAKT